MSSIRRNTLALTALQVANVLLPLATLPYLLRVLGPEQFGAYSLAQAIPAYGVIIADFGFNLTATQRVAEMRGDQEAISRYFWSVQAAKIVLAVLALLGLALIVACVPQFRSLWPTLLAGALVIPATVLYPQWLFMGLERMTWITVCSVSARLLTLPMIFLLVKDSSQAWLAVLIAASAPLLAGVCAIWLIRRLALVRWRRPQLAAIRAALEDGWHIFLSTAAISAYTTVTPVLLGLLTNTTVVGLFSAADRIRQACQGLLTPLSNAAFPRVSAAMQQDKVAGLTLVRKLLAVQSALTLSASAVIWFAAPHVVPLLMGHQFDGAVEVLRYLAPVLFIVGLSNIFGIQTMLPLGLKAPFNRIVMASGLINISLLLFLAPRFGAIGAAASTLITECIVTVLMAWVLRMSNISIIRLHPGRPDS